MRFEIVDPKDPQHLDLLTPNETGTLPWTLEQIDFTTGAQTHLILVRLARKSSERLDNKLRGTAWIDDVTIVPSDGGFEGPGQEIISQDHAKRCARAGDGQRGSRFQMQGKHAAPRFPMTAVSAQP